MRDLAVEVLSGVAFATLLIVAVWIVRLTLMGARWLVNKAARGLLGGK